MTNYKTFKPVDLEYRGNSYATHHSLMLNGSRRFLSDTACPKCGEYQRIRTFGKGMVEKSSQCVTCHKKHSIKTVDTSVVDRRRAIEAHQERATSDSLLFD